MEIGRTTIDKTLVNEGVWTEFVLVTGEGEPEVVKLKMAYASGDMNNRYRDAMQRALDPYQRVMSSYTDPKDFPDGLVRKINDIGVKVFVEQIVLDWEGPTKNGQKQPYTPEACMALFEEFPELRKQAQAEAGKIQRYRTKALEEAGKA